jgi:hypothetical protein
MSHGIIAHVLILHTININKFRQKNLRGNQKPNQSLIKVMGKSKGKSNQKSNSLPNNNNNKKLVKIQKSKGEGEIERRLKTDLTVAFFGGCGGEKRRRLAFW